MADLMSSFFNSDFGCVSVRTKVSDPHAYGAHAPRCPPLLGQRPRLCLLSTGTNDYEEEVGALLPGQVRDPRASLWRADCDPAYLEPVDPAGLRVQQKPKVRHYPLASLSSRMQRSRAPRPPPSTPPSPSTYVHAQAYEITVDGCASGLGLGLDSVNRVTILKPGGPADACGLIAVGDRIVNVDGEPLGGLQLQQVLRPADRHVFVLEVGQMAASEARAARGSRWGVGSTSSPVGARGSRLSSLSPLSSPKGGHVHV